MAFGNGSGSVTSRQAPASRPSAGGDEIVRVDAGAAADVHDVARRASSRRRLARRTVIGLGRERHRDRDDVGFGREQRGAGRPSDALDEIRALGCCCASRSHASRSRGPRRATSVPMPPRPTTSIVRPPSRSSAALGAAPARHAPRCCRRDGSGRSRVSTSIIANTCSAIAGPVGALHVGEQQAALGEARAPRRNVRRRR